MTFIDIDAVFNARLDYINLILFSEYEKSILEFIWNKYIYNIGPWTLDAKLENLLRDCLHSNIHRLSSTKTKYLK